MSLETPLTKLLGMKHPVMLAGMGGAAGPGCAAAVANAGGFGTIGGGMLTPRGLEKTLDMLKEELDDKNAPFGVDLLIPQVGGSARKTNYDYTRGNLDKLGDVMIEKGCKLFVCAVGVPPKWYVEKMHAHGIVVMNMVGAVKHVAKALAVGVDIICAQGGEGGGHTGDIASSILLPKVVDAVKGHVSPLTGDPVIVVAAGGIFDGRGLAMALSMGASGVWVGTRFVACEESEAAPYHKKVLMQAGYTDTLRTLIYTGRPMRTFRTPFLNEWETVKKDKADAALAKGVLPFPIGNETKGIEPLPEGFTGKDWIARRPWLMGQNCGAIEDIKTAKEIVDEMVGGAVEQLNRASSFVVTAARL